MSKEPSGEDIGAAISKALKEMGLDDSIGFVLFDNTQFELVYQSPDVMLIGRLPKKGNGVRLLYSPNASPKDNK